MNWKAFLLVFLFPALLCAQTPIQIWPPGEDKITPLKLGEKAPHDGQLFDSATALRWGYAVQQYQLRLKADVELEQKVCAARLTYSGKLLSIEKDRSQLIEKDLRQRLKKSEQARLDAEERARNQAWYSTRTFGIIVGVVSTSAIFALSIWAVDSLKK
jgi:hypothetical protein